MRYPVSSLRGAQLRSLPIQRRLLATPPTSPPPPGSTTSPTGTHIPSSTAPSSTPGTSTLNVPPVSPSTPPLAAAPPPTQSTGPTTFVPPPTPPPPPPKSHFFRRLLILTTLGIVTFYPVSGWLSTQYEGYRELFVNNVPGGEAVAEYADDHSWETFGFGTVSQKAVQGWQYVTGEDKKPNTTAEKVAQRTRQVERDVKTGLQTAKEEVKKVEKKAETKVDQAASKVKAEASKVAGKAEKQEVTLREKAVEKATEASEKVKSLAAVAQEKVSDAASSVPFNFSEGVEGMVREAEKALARGENKVEELGQEVKEKIDSTPGAQGYLDAQKPRQLRPETVKPAKPTYEGQSLYAGPPLPVGFEPPPGYYVAPPPAPKKPEEKVKETLPLLVPRVKDFGASEPIISQLASTIDSLTQSLSTPSSGNSSGILTKAHDDLTALSQRLDSVKASEKQKLEETLAAKAEEFQNLLRDKENERQRDEQGLREGWNKERQKMVDEWRSALETELELQREGIEHRLREEVVSQGIELQRRWLRSIKSQVETERGGRLAKLDTLSTSLKQLERITLDNSATLDDNLRLHKVWSALRAVQTKAEQGDTAFDDELRVLRSLSTPEDKSLINTTLQHLEKTGIPQTGVKSFVSLSSWFSNSVAPRCQSASLVPSPENASVLSHLASASLSKFMFQPKAGKAQGDDVAAVLARAEYCLGEKDLDGAAREVNSLRGWPGKLASDWLREARRRLEVMQALEVVGTEATLGSLLLV